MEDDDKVYYTTTDKYTFTDPGRMIGILVSLPIASTIWECQLFGAGDNIVLVPQAGKEPNWFWRWMQYFCFGNKWIKKVDHANP